MYVAVGRPPCPCSCKGTFTYSPIPHRGTVRGGCGWGFGGLTTQSNSQPVSQFCPFINPSIDSSIHCILLYVCCMYVCRNERTNERTSEPTISASLGRGQNSKNATEMNNSNDNNNNNNDNDDDDDKKDGENLCRRLPV